MKLATLSLLLGVAFGIKCYKQTPSWKVKKTGGISWGVGFSGIGWPGIFECGGIHKDKFSCGSTKFEGEYTRTERAFFGLGAPTEVTYNYESEAKACTPNAVCEKLAGGVSSCQKASYEYEKWIPRSCNATADYDAITEDYKASVSLSCCNDANQCNQNEDYSGCSEVTSFSTYITSLNTCWNDYKKTFMAELLCDNNGIPNRDILSWGQNCTEEDGSWKTSLRSKLRCRYKPTCAAEMRQTLTDYATCACKAATDNGYSGEFIGTVMKTNWQRFCPNVEISCAPDTGIAEVLYKYWVVKARFKIALAKANITDAIKAKIKAKIADKLNVDPITITITINAPVTTSTRRLLQDSSNVDVTFTAEDENTKKYGESGMDQTLASQLSSELGATVTKDSVDSEEGSDGTTKTYQTTPGGGGGDAGNRWNANVASFVAIFVGIIAFN